MEKDKEKLEQSLIDVKTELSLTSFKLKEITARKEEFQDELDKEKSKFIKNRKK